MTKYHDYPIEECAAALEQILHDEPQTTFFQKWTCGKCGERVVGSNANKLFTEGLHDEKDDGSPCGHVTDIRKTGCNYMLVRAFKAPAKGNA